MTVVFHDMLSAGSTPLSTNNNYNTIISALNNIYNGINLGGKIEANDTGILFCNAQQDSNGKTYSLNSSQPNTNVTTITRNDMNDPLRTVINSIILASQQNEIAANSNFFSKQNFINIYIVDNIEGNVAGFASMPPSHGGYVDGIFIERDFLQNNVSFANNMNVLAHEMGHYLGLFHVFGICDPEVLPNFPQCSCDNGNPLFNGDMVADTPPSQLNLTQNNCNTPFDTCPASIGNDDKSNYMDYGNWSCQFRFTPGQIQRMRFMLDPISGPRKSLLNTQNACTDCSAMSGVSFSIVQPPNMGTDPHFALNANGQVPANVFSVSTTTASSTNIVPVMQYNWSIMQLNGNGSTLVVGSTSTAIIYNMPNNLAVGNYRLKVSVGTNATCFKSLTLDFQVLPHAPAGSCNLNLPTDNSWAGWSRSSYVNGWSRSSSPPYNLNYPNAQRFTPTDNAPGQFDTTGFAIINNPQTNLNDTNFVSATNLPATVNRVIRVGRSIENESTVRLPGNAYHATVSFRPNAQNCKYRIWYLGYKQIINSGTTFGFVSQYRFDSPIQNFSTINPTIIGSTEYGLLSVANDNTLINNNGNYTINDMQSCQVNDFTSNYFPIGTSGHRMLNWYYYDVDYSEFVANNLNTIVDITFFAKSNNAINSQVSSYAYFGIECLGGGLQKIYNLSLPDINLNCQTNIPESCAILTIPAPVYVQKRINFAFGQNTNQLIWNSQNNNLGRISILKANESGAFLPVLSSITTQGSETDAAFRYGINLCLNENDVPYRDFIINVETIHNVVRDTIRVFKGFTVNEPICSPLESFTGGMIPNGQERYIILCGQENPPLLIMNRPCYANNNEILEYRWLLNFVVLPNSNTENYQTIVAQYNSGLITSYTRQVRYRNIYCGGNRWIDSETYTVRKISLYFYPTFAAINDSCLSLTDTISINGSIPISGGIIGVLTNINPHIIVQLYNISNGQLLGNPQTLPVTIGNYGITMTVPNFILTFINNNGNGNFIFNSGNASIGIRVINNIYQCGSGNIINAWPNTNIVFGVTATSGQISYNCGTNQINNVADGVNGSGYLWQYSPNVTGSFVFLTNAPQTATLSTNSISEIRSLLNNSNIFFVRRVSTPAGQCSATATSNIVSVNLTNQFIIPTFTQLPTSICLGQSIPVLPTTSTNFIQGNWVALASSTATIKKFEFVPLPSQCVTTPNVTHSYTIRAAVVPSFNLPNTVCANVSLSLPATSTNSIQGLWTPPVVTQTGVYTFTPASGTCAVSVTRTITVTPVLSLLFAELNAVKQVCLNTAPTMLPSAANNGAIGTWKNQNGVQVTTTTTTTAGTYTYTFVLNGDSCSKFVFRQVVKPNNIIPIFGYEKKLCKGNTPPILSTISSNNIIGTWQPAVVNNMATTNYQFTPNIGQCAVLPPPLTISIQDDCTIGIDWTNSVGCQTQNQDPKRGQSDITDAACLRVCENTNVSYNLTGGIGAIANTQWIVTGGSIVSSNNTSCEILWGTSAFSALQINLTYTNGTQRSVTKCIEKVASPKVNYGAFGYAVFDNEKELTICIGTTLNFKNLSNANLGNSILY